MVDFRGIHLSLLLLQKLVVRVDIRCDHDVSDPLVRHAVHQHLLDQFVLQQNRFHLLREDVLAALGDDDSLFPSGHINEPVFVDVAEIAGVKPPVVQNLLCRLRVLIVSQHHRGPLADDLPYSVLVGIDDANLSVRHRQTDGFRLAVPVLIHRDDRRILTHAVSLNHREAHGLKIFDDLWIDGRTARNELLHVAAEGLMNRLEHPLDDGFVVIQFQALRQRDGVSELVALPPGLRLLEHAFVHLLKDEGHAQHNVGMNLRHVLLYIAQSLADGDGLSLIECCPDVAGHLVGMVHRQDGQHDARFRNFKHHGHILHVGRDVPLRQHDALGQAGGSGGEHQRRHLVGIDVRTDITAIPCLKELPPLPDELIHGQNPVRIFVSVDRNEKFNIKGIVKKRPDALLGFVGIDNRAGAGSFHQSHQFILRKVLVQRHDGADACNHGEVGEDPVVAGLADDRDLPALQSHVNQFCPEAVQILLHFPVGDGNELAELPVLHQIRRVLRKHTGALYDDVLQIGHIPDRIVNALVFFIIHMVSF